MRRFKCVKKGKNGAKDKIFALGKVIEICFFSALLCSLSHTQTHTTHEGDAHNDEERIHKGVICVFLSVKIDMLNTILFEEYVRQLVIVKLEYYVTFTVFPRGQKSRNKFLVDLVQNFYCRNHC